MKKEIFSKTYKKALTSSVAALLLASAVSMTAFADNSSADALPTATDSGFVDGCIPDSQETIQEHLASDAEVYDLDYIEDSDDGMYDSLVQVCKAAEIASSESSVDLTSQFPTPRSQGSQGSCTAWAVGYALKSHQEYVEHGWEFNDNTIYSPSFIYNQIKLPNNSGSYISDGLNLLINKGDCSLKAMKYNQYDSTTMPNASQKDKASNFKNKSYKTLNGIDAVKARLRAGDGVVISIWDTSDFADNNTKSDNGIFDKVSDEDKEDYGVYDKFGFHALCIVGYDDNYKDKNGDTVPSFKFMNSWGSNWGYGGFGYISYDLFESKYGASNYGYYLDDDTHQNTDKFFTSNPGYVKTTANVRAYTDPQYYDSTSSSDMYEHTISSGETLKIDSFIAASNGNQPCFKTSDGLYINASKEQLEAVTAGEVRNVFISGSNNNSVYSYNNSETSSIKFNTNNSTQYNNHNTLRIDYTVNQSDSYNGYAGAKIQADSTVSTSGAKGLGFWYMTPSGQNGTVAFCMQGSVNKKLVELPTTNGEWKYYSNSYSFNGSSISDIEMYVNGNESNCKTTPATGTLYIADLAVVSEGSTPVIEQKTYYSFSCQAASSSAGTATATIEDGKYAKGTYVTVAASAKSDYKFIGWSKSKNGDVFNTNTTYSFNLTEDTALYAQFEEDETYYLSVVKGDGCQKISITTADNVSKEFEYARYPAGMTTVEVVGESGYTFKGWYTNAVGIGDPLSTSTKYTFNLKGITTLYPLFVKNGETEYTVNVVKTEGYSRVALFSEGSNGLTFTSGTFKPGKSITLIAQASSGYNFEGWYTNSSFSGTPVSTSSAYTFTVNSDVTLYPKFVSDDSAYRTLTVECDEHGHTEGTASGKYLQGKYITVTAYADDGYEFTGWTKGKNGDLVTDYYYYSFNLDEDTTLYAHFEKLPVYTLTVAQTEGLSYASIDGNKAYTATFEKGSNYGVDVFAYAKSGYKFAGWYTNSSFSGDPVETSYHYTFDINSDTTLYPKFVKT
ncbi:MAG: InlB B-repeat-containing protein, partial [Oscillospiraceae bacterium]